MASPATYLTVAAIGGGAYAMSTYYRNRRSPGAVPGITETGSNFMQDFDTDNLMLHSGSNIQKTNIHPALEQPPPPRPPATFSKPEIPVAKPTFVPDPPKPPQKKPPEVTHNEAAAAPKHVLIQPPPPATASVGKTIGAAVPPPPAIPQGFMQWSPPHQLEYVSNLTHAQREALFKELPAITVSNIKMFADARRKKEQGI